MPALLAAYAATPCWAANACTEETATIAPPPRARRCGMARAAGEEDALEVDVEHLVPQRLAVSSTVP